MKINTTLHRLLIGLTLALAFIFLQMGIAEIFLGQDLQCRALVDTMRLRYDPGELCLSEINHYLTYVLARGPFSGYGAAAISAWLGNAILYGVIGAIGALFKPRTALIIFGSLHILLTVIGVVVNMISPYLVP